MEVFDYSAALSSRKSRRRMRSTPLAWGFLRTINLKGKINIRTTRPDTDATTLPPLRLQLYEYQFLSPLILAQAKARGLTQPGVPSVYLQYLSQYKVKMHAALAVQAHPMPRPHAEIMLSLNRMHNPVKDGGGLMDSPNLDEREEGGGSGIVAKKPEGKKNIMEGLVGSGTAYLRARSPHEPCLLPNKLLHRLNAGALGATAVRFSNSGKQLAVACCADKVFTVRIYDPETGQLCFELRPAHFSVIYEVRWSDDDRHLISASGDGTCHIWRVNGAPYVGHDTIVMEPSEASDTPDNGDSPVAAEDKEEESAVKTKYPQHVTILHH